MSAPKKAMVFLTITFAISWAALIGGWLRGARLGSDWYVGSLMIAGPLIAALACALVFEQGRRVEVLGLRLKPNWWWIAAVVLPLAVAALSIVLTILLSDRSYLEMDEGLRRAARALGQDVSQPQRVFPNVARGTGILIIQSFLTLTLTEELAWRGYLYHLWRPFGFWRASFAIGFVWGVWHIPALVLFGLLAPDQPWLVAVLYPLWTTVLAPLFTLLRDRGRSIWATGICHAVISGTGILTVVTLDNTAFPWTGVQGIGGFIALALLNLAIHLLRLAD